MAGLFDNAVPDTWSDDWRLDCLARHICRLPNKVARHAFLDRMRQKQTDEFMIDIERRVRIQWDALRQREREGAHGVA